MSRGEEMGRGRRWEEGGDGKMGRGRSENCTLSKDTISKFSSNSATRASRISVWGSTAK
jgi:hypothetical protein